MLVGNTTVKRDIPHEPGEWMTFKLLSWRSLEEARALRQTAALRSFQGVADVVRELQSARTPEVAGAAVEVPDPTSSFDRATLLVRGIHAWSYDAPLTPAALDDLDEQTAEWAAKEIVSLHSRTEEERLNGFFRTGTVASG